METVDANCRVSLSSYKWAISLGTLEEAESDLYLRDIQRAEIKPGANAPCLHELTARLQSTVVSRRYSSHTDTEAPRAGVLSFALDLLSEHPLADLLPAGGDQQNRHPSRSVSNQ